jgi:hypothetical protein
MPAKRDLITEIEEVRGRMAAVDDLDSGILKLLMIVDSTKKLQDEDPENELHAYYIVASIAAIESYFRWQIQRLIDFGNGRFLNNVRLDDQPIKLTHDVAVALVNKRVTIGELLAHTVGFSNFERVAAFMTKLLGTDFVQLVAGSSNVDPDNATLLEDSAQVISDVKRSLELRHLICHEGYRNHLIPTLEIKQLSSSCYTFVRGSYYAISRFLDPAGPATQEDLYKATSIEANGLQIRLKALEEAIAIWNEIHFVLWGKRGMHTWRKNQPSSPQSK